jgi:hypothetical protein
MNNEATTEAAETGGESLEDLKSKLDALLDAAMTDKGKLDALCAHYRVTGLYHYSMLNSMLIAVQGGQICQSFKGWQSVGRYVKKGERARISIWRPASRRTNARRPSSAAPANEAEAEADPAAATQAEDFNGRPVFWLCKVFDYGQTDGAPLAYEHNSAVPESFSWEGYRAAAAVLGYNVETEALAGPRGYTDGRRVVVSALSNDVDRTKTLLHELGHCLLGHCGDWAIERDTREIEAEAVAHLCCSVLGVNYDLSAEYVANYISGREHVRKTKVIRTAQKIIAACIEASKGRADGQAAAGANGSTGETSKAA